MHASRGGSHGGSTASDQNHMVIARALCACFEADDLRSDPV